MTVKDLDLEQVRVGLRVKSLAKEKWGTVVQIDIDDDHYAWIKWDGDDQVSSGFYGNHCDCQVSLSSE